MRGVKKDRRLKFAIINAELTQREVSIAAQIPEGRLSEIVRGVRQPPTRAEQRALARALHVPLEDLFARESNQEEASR